MVCSIVQMKDEMGEACGTYRERRNTYRLLTGKAEVKRTLGIDGRILLKCAFSD